MGASYSPYASRTAAAWNRPAGEHFYNSNDVGALLRVSMAVVSNEE